MNSESSVRKNDVDDLKNEVYYSIAVAKFLFLFFIIIIYFRQWHKSKSTQRTLGSSVSEWTKKIQILNFLSCQSVYHKQH